MRHVIRTAPLDRIELSRAEQLREARSLMRHFTLSFTVSGASLYIAMAAGYGF